MSVGKAFVETGSVSPRNVLQGVELPDPVCLHASGPEPLFAGGGPSGPLVRTEDSGVHEVRDHPAHE